MTPLLTQLHRAYFEKFCADSRRTGSQHLRDMQRFLAQEFQSLGICPDSQTSHIIGWDSVVSPEVKVVRPTEKRLVAHPVMWSPSTGGTLRGVVKDCGKTLTYEQYRWKRYGVVDEDGYILCYLLSNPDIKSWIQTQDAPDDPIPALTVDCFDDFTRWLDAGEEIEVEVSMTNRFYADCPLVNVIGEARRSPNALVTCHLDSVYNGAGAHDNCSGVIAMLDLAGRGRRASTERVRYVAFDGEELNKIGAYNYAAELEQTGELENFSLQVNFDSVAIGDFIYVLCTPDLYDQLSALFAGTTVMVTQRETFKQFDTWPFAEKGLPAIQIGSTSKTDPYGFFNHPADNLVDSGHLLSSARIAEATDAAAAILDDFYLNPGAYQKHKAPTTSKPEPARLA